MADLVSRYRRLKEEIDEVMFSMIESSSFISGPMVKVFDPNLTAYLDTEYVVPCGNYTDALQVALMHLNLKRGDEVIVPAFAYAATAEAAVLLGLVSVLVDVDKRTFNTSPETIAEAITDHTKVIIAVHLFGRSCNIYPILELAREDDLYVIEDNTQSLDAEYTFPDRTSRKTGTVGDIDALSFFPTEILECYGDGGAVTIRNADLTEEIRMTTVHGQNMKYHHQIIGYSSHLDTLQAAISNAKLKHVDDFIASRQAAVRRHDADLSSLDGVLLPTCIPSSTHVYHQYTIQVLDDRCEALQNYLKEHRVLALIYYPAPVQEQIAFKDHARHGGDLSVTKHLTQGVLSLSIHTEMEEDVQEHIICKIKDSYV